MLPRSERLTSAQFDRAFSRAQSVRHPLVVLRAYQRGDGDDSTHAAFVVPKKQGKATMRNRVKRRLRERYRLHPRRNRLQGCDLIFLSTPETGRASDEQLDGALEEVLRRMSKKVGGNAPPNAPAKRELLPHNREEVIPSTSTPGEVQGEASVTKSELEVEMPPAPSPITGFARLALTLIRFYQRFISPGLPPSCRFLPTCSHYTYGAIERFGAGRGLYLGVRRVCRCNPFHPGGIDPVPEIFPHMFSIRKLEKSLSRRRFWSSKPEG